MIFEPSNKKYPELFLSNNIHNLLQMRPSLPPKPIMPQEPPEPVNPGEDNSSIGCPLTALIGTIIGLICVIGQGWADFKIVICFIGLILVFWFLVKIGIWESNSHIDKKREYENDLRCYPAKQNDYSHKLAQYNREKTAYDEKVNEMMSCQELGNFRRQQIANWRSQLYVPKFEECNPDEDIKKGASEDFFTDYILEHFNYYINQKIPAGAKFYYPDIIVEYEGFYIDVEIDEPYSGKDGTPIHYLDTNYGGKESIDFSRNLYFMEKGWIIIRFAEEQIFKNPSVCIDFIKDAINGIIDGDISSITIPDDFSINKWTQSIAHQWAYKRYRHTYVPQRFQKFIDAEEWTEKDEIKKNNRYNHIDPDEGNDLPF